VEGLTVGLVEETTVGFIVGVALGFGVGGEVGFRVGFPSENSQVLRGKKYKSSSQHASIDSYNSPYFHAPPHGGGPSQSRTHFSTFQST